MATEKSHQEIPCYYPLIVYVIINHHDLPSLSAGDHYHAVSKLTHVMSSDLVKFQHTLKLKKKQNRTLLVYGF